MIRGAYASSPLRPSCSWGHTRWLAKGDSEPVSCQRTGPAHKLQKQEKNQIMREREREREKGAGLMPVRPAPIPAWLLTMIACMMLWQHLLEVQVSCLSDLHLYLTLGHMVACMQGLKTEVSPACQTPAYPCPSCPCFLKFLLWKKFPCEVFLCFLSVAPFFSRDLGVS